jgi:hypothetical protein
MTKVIVIHEEWTAGTGDYPKSKDVENLSQPNGRMQRSDRERYGGVILRRRTGVAVSWIEAREMRYNCRTHAELTALR